MATAKKLPSGSYRIRVHVGNGKYRSFTAPTKKEAEYIAARYLQENRKNAPDMLVGEAIDKYIESKENILSPSTIREYKRIRKHSMQDIINIKLSALTQDKIQYCINKEALSHSPKSVKNMHGFLSSVLKVFKPELRLTTSLPQKTKTEISVPLDADIKRLLAAAKDHPIENPILLAAFGSLRRGEVCALTKNDIVGNTVNINKSYVKDYNGKWILKSPKTFAGFRRIDLPENIIEIITSKENICEYNPDQLTKAFALFIKNNNLPHMRFHDLRHYQASILLALGVPDKYIMERGGWSSRTTLNNVYQHIMKDKENEFINRANDYFSRLIEDDKEK